MKLTKNVYEKKKKKTKYFICTIAIGIAISIFVVLLKFKQNKQEIPRTECSLKLVYVVHAILHFFFFNTTNNKYNCNKQDYSRKKFWRLHVT